MVKKIKFIAEIGSNHNRDINRCLKLVDIAKSLDCYAVKFQMFKIENLFAKEFIKKNPNIKKNRRNELPKSFVPIISRYCKKKKIKFSCTPFDLESVHFLNKYVDFFKIASYELLWSDLLKECAKTGKPLILSTGMASELEVKNALKTLNLYKAKKISLLHCVSSYPADILHSNLRSIQFMRKKFKLEIGWSDHTVNPLAIYSSVANFGASIVEFHFDLDGKGWEFSHNHCWLPKDIKNVIKFINNEKKINGKFQKKYSQGEIKERFNRADPFDGLRPIKSSR